MPIHSRRRFPAAYPEHKACGVPAGIATGCPAARTIDPARGCPAARTIGPATEVFADLDALGAALAMKGQDIPAALADSAKAGPAVRAALTASRDQSVSEAPLKAVDSHRYNYS